jgi:hypothetical protein
VTAALTQYTASAGDVEEPWIPRSYGRHSDTRYLDEPTIPVWFLLKRENYAGTPRSHLKEEA